MLKSFFKKISDILSADITLRGLHVNTPEERRAEADKWLKETKDFLALQRNCEICEMRIAHPGIQLPYHKCAEHQRK